MGDELKCNCCSMLVWINQQNGPPLQFCLGKHVELTNGYMMLFTSQNCKFGTTKFLNHLKALLIRTIPSRLFTHISNIYYRLFKSDKLFIQRLGNDYLLYRDGLRLLSYTPKFVGFGLHNFCTFERFFQIAVGDVCVDVGACIGDTTIPMLLKTGIEGTVHAVEPSSINLQYLRFNLSSYPNAITHKIAVSDKTGFAQLHLHKSPTGHSLLPGSHRNSSVMVKTETLDNLLADVHVDFLKIDVQGSELEVLKGATKTLRKVPKLIVETHGYRGSDPTYPVILEALRHSNFREVRFCMDNGLVYAWR